MGEEEEAEGVGEGGGRGEGEGGEEGGGGEVELDEGGVELRELGGVTAELYEREEVRGGGW